MTHRAAGARAFLPPYKDPAAAILLASCLTQSDLSYARKAIALPFAQHRTRAGPSFLSSTLFSITLFKGNMAEAKAAQRIWLESNDNAKIEVGTLASQVASHARPPTHP